jgi:protein-L-isoaspartate(D-aspartate) O-methyltransferase
MTATTAADAEEARRLRDAMTDKLVRLGSVTSPQIETAIRTVPRHAFARPGTPLEECYHGDIVRNKKDADGVTLSSISGAWLQARMIAQAGVGPGARVLEIGTTGYNAALIAEVVGPGGHVVTVDIDPEVAGWAAAALQATGYSDRVSVLTGDGEHGAPGHGPFDAIIATAGAWGHPARLDGAAQTDRPGPPRRRRRRVRRAGLRPPPRRRCRRPRRAPARMGGPGPRPATGRLHVLAGRDHAAAAGQAAERLPQASRLGHYHLAA